MSLQEIFDKSVGGVLAQGGLGMRHGVCLYRAPDGKRCAVGQLLDDGVYSPSFEALPLRSIVSRLPPSLGRQVDLLNKLQIAHDASYGLADFASTAAKLAAKLNLNTKVIDDWRARSAESDPT